MLRYIKVIACCDPDFSHWASANVISLALLPLDISILIYRYGSVWVWKMPAVPKSSLVNVLHGMVDCQASDQSVFPQSNRCQYKPALIYYNSNASYFQESIFSAFCCCIEACIIAILLFELQAKVKFIQVMFTRFVLRSKVWMHKLLA